MLTVEVFSYVFWDLHEGILYHKIQCTAVHTILLLHLTSINNRSPKTESQTEINLITQHFPPPSLPFQCTIRMRLKYVPHIIRFDRSQNGKLPINLASLNRAMSFHFWGVQYRIGPVAQHHPQQVALRYPGSEL